MVYRRSERMIWAGMGLSLEDKGPAPFCGGSWMPASGIYTLTDKK